MQDESEAKALVTNRPARLAEIVAHGRTVLVSLVTKVSRSRCHARRLLRLRRALPPRNETAADNIDRCEILEEHRVIDTVRLRRRAPASLSNSQIGNRRPLLIELSETKFRNRP